MMTLSAAAALLACLTLAGLLGIAEYRSSARWRWLFKPATSTLFVIAGLGRAPTGPYDWLVVAGLGLSLVGDVALIPPGEAWFLAGLVAFLGAHIAYAAAFLTPGGVAMPNPLAAGLGIAAAAGFIAYFRPHLGRMFWPVIAYVGAITLMIVAAWSLGDRVSAATASRAALGATLFYLSDLTVARDRFLSGTGYPNRAIGLALYYVGQFLLAFSIRA
jgi:uncharacterized membrane protein YhhN